MKLPPGLRGLLGEALMHVVQWLLGMGPNGGRRTALGKRAASPEARRPNAPPRA